MALPAEQIPKPRFVTVHLQRGGQLQKVRLNLNYPRDRSLWVSSLDIKPGPKSLLRLLAVENFNVHLEDARPSVGVMARHTGYSMAAIHRHLKYLKAKGLLVPIETSRRGVVTYRVVIEGILRPVEAPPKNDEVEQPNGQPQWLHRNAQVMAHWRWIYFGDPTEEDLESMPFWVAEILFEEGRQPVEKTVDMGNLPMSKRDTSPPSPISKRDTSLSQNETQTEKRTETGTEQNCTEVRRLTPPPTTQSTPFGPTQERDLVQTWERITGSPMNGKNRPPKVYRPRGFSGAMRWTWDRTCRG